MPAFAFRAVDAAGRTQRGVLEASSAVGARRTLRERELLPVSVEPAGSAPTFGTASQTAAPSLSRLWRPRLSSRGLAVATRQLSTLIGSDIRIEEALRVVAQQAGSGPAGPLLLSVRGAVLEGRSFAAALAEHPGAFPEFYRASVAAGEQSGRLSEVLARLTDFLEARARGRRKIALALLYPSLLAVVAGGMITLLMIYVIPDITRVFINRGAELPILTRALIALSDGIRAWGLWIAVAFLIAVVAARRWLAGTANRLIFAQWVATTPPFASFSRQLNAARFAASLATLLRSDVPLVEALLAAAAVTPNAWVRSRAERVAARVREGTTLRDAMTDAGCFPSMLLAIVASGEGAGQLGPALSRAADDLEREVDALTTTLTALVEPAVLLFMGGVVLLMVLAILTPIINLNNLAGT